MRRKRLIYYRKDGVQSYFYSRVRKTLDDRTSEREEEYIANPWPPGPLTALDLFLWGHTAKIVICA